MPYPERLDARVHPPSDASCEIQGDEYGPNHDDEVLRRLGHVFDMPTAFAACPRVYAMCCVPFRELIRVTLRPEWLTTP